LSDHLAKHSRTFFQGLPAGESGLLVTPAGGRRFTSTLLTRYLLVFEFGSLSVVSTEKTPELPTSFSD
jgi:hypothetical protein